MILRFTAPRPMEKWPWLLAALLLCMGMALSAFSTTTLAAESVPPDWRHLSPAQQHILAPLQSEWTEFDHDRKRKWLDIAARYPAMSAEQQQTLQRRMNEWAHLSPEKRRLARENFLSTGKAPLQSRREAWEAYQKLPEAERERLKEEARHPKPHPGQVGKYLQEKHGAAARKPPIKHTAPTPSTATPAARASSTVPCADVLRCPAR
ncbi:DUF3106 domain-containing protein [Thiomonas intermedia]|uniref:DUF3106 domain-containing protein n=1 Tax=Thiomonas intermedia TaxID=926 RepID=UPI0012AC507B|nr:DUF3106 domain-containing protein [Thiomonas intermedia]